jgi:hypothetical protein
VMFLRACLSQLQRATSDGAPVHGYFHWSAQDNLEWLSGFGDRFGLIYVDFDTLERTPKLGAQVVPGGRAAQRSRLRGPLSPCHQLTDPIPPAADLQSGLRILAAFTDSSRRPARA